MNICFIIYRDLLDLHLPSSSLITIINLVFLVTYSLVKFLVLSGGNTLFYKIHTKYTKYSSNKRHVKLLKNSAHIAFVGMIILITWGKNRSIAEEESRHFHDVVLS